MHCKRRLHIELAMPDRDGEGREAQPRRTALRLLCATRAASAADRSSYAAGAGRLHRRLPPHRAAVHGKDDPPPGCLPSGRRDIQTYSAVNFAELFRAAVPDELQGFPAAPGAPDVKIVGRRDGGADHGVGQGWHRD